MTQQQAEILLETVRQSLLALLKNAQDIDYARGHVKALLAHVDSAQARWDRPDNDHSLKR